MIWLLLGSALLLLPTAGAGVSGAHRRGADGSTSRAGEARRSAWSGGRLRGIASLSLGMLPVVVIGGSTGVILGAIAAAFGLALTGNAAPPIPLVAADVVSVPLVLDLVVTALRSGLPVDAALAEGAAAAASSQVRDELLRISGLLRLGSSPESAWSRFAADPRLRAVAVVATRSANSGIRLADGWSATAHQLRLDAAAAAMSRAGRVGTWSMAPLGLCFLPAFICLGIAPVVIGLASGMLNGDLL